MIDSAFHTGNRRSFQNLIGDELFVLSGYEAVQLTGDREVPFEQEANFWYLTGIEEADWQLILDGSFVALVRPDVDPIHAVFNGGLSTEEAQKVSGIDTVISFEEAAEHIKRAAEDKKIASTIQQDWARHGFTPNPAPEKLHRKLKKLFGEVTNRRLELARLRAIKQPVEILAIREAIDLTVEAFALVARQLQDLNYEYEIQAEFDYHFAKHGSTHAYEPIVATGKNACTLHYVKNTEQLRAGELTLLDIGARVQGYSADITRTYAYGEVSSRHKAVHEAVERAHKEIISLLKPQLSVKEYHESVDQIMSRELQGLGLIDNLDDPRYRDYFPHAVSHGLGIDVHDPLGAPEYFLEGIVLTVEPGIYIPEEGIGVRIEDDILITSGGHENLSIKLPTSL